MDTDENLDVANWKPLLSTFLGGGSKRFILNTKKGKVIASWLYSCPSRVGFDWL